MEPLKADAVCHRCGSTKDLSLCSVCKKPMCMRERIGTGSISDGYQCSMACALRDALPSEVAPKIETPPPPSVKPAYSVPLAQMRLELEAGPMIVPHEPEKTGIHYTQKVKSAGKFILGIVLGLLMAEVLHQFFGK